MLRVVTFIFTVSVLISTSASDAVAQQKNRFLESDAQSTVSNVKAKRWLMDAEKRDQLIEHRRGVFVQIQKGKDHGGNCVMDVPATHENRFTGKKTFRVNKAVNICE